jgi:hypothetical protein
MLPPFLACGVLTGHYMFFEPYLLILRRALAISLIILLFGKDRLIRTLPFLKDLEFGCLFSSCISGERPNFLDTENISSTEGDGIDISIGTRLPAFLVTDESK